MIFLLLPTLGCLLLGAPVVGIVRAVGDHEGFKDDGARGAAVQVQRGVIPFGFVCASRMCARMCACIRAHVHVSVECRRIICAGSSMAGKGQCEEAMVQAMHGCWGI